MTKINKKVLLNESKTFCMFPWVHLNVTPKGDVYPCCSNNYTTPFANTNDVSLEEAFNVKDMKLLRKNMLSNKKSKICEFCYKQEEIGNSSFRSFANENFGRFFDEIVHTTEEDGKVNDFKMRYVDIRFSNICNFKCRTCGSEFSSKWAEEQAKHQNFKTPTVIHADATGALLKEVIEQIEYIDMIYFAGGEPLLTEEHYIILDNLIQAERTNVKLKYNTNLSTLKYKGRDIVSLWKKFESVNISCSIDHFGEKAEWIRHGTNWKKIEENLQTVSILDHITFEINTVLSFFNYPSITDFYEFMIDKKIITPESSAHTLTPAINPPYYNPQSLPIEIKKEAGKKCEKFIKKYQKSYPHICSILQDGMHFTKQKNTWEKEKNEFLRQTKYIDQIRNENFFTKFSEIRCNSLFYNNFYLTLSSSNYTNSKTTLVFDINQSSIAQKWANEISLNYKLKETKRFSEWNETEKKYPCPRIVGTFQNRPKYLLQTSDYKLFTFQWEYGTIYINYCEVGMPLLDAFKVTNYNQDEIVPLKHYSADFMAWFGPNIPDDYYNSRLENFLLWYEKQNLNLDMDKLALGMIPVAKINLEKNGLSDLSQNEVNNYLKNFNIIDSVKVS
jgi:MoaA/NifB/PqqE/SkfB family radical SAM enzyme